MLGDFQKRRIAANLGQQLEKEGQDISKSVEFVKTGKEVQDALKKKMVIFSDTIAYLEEIKRECRNKIGYDPDKVETYGEELQVSYEGERKPLKYYYDEDYNANPPSEIEKCKRRYNKACWKIDSLKEISKKLQKIMDNVKVNQRFTLSSYELEEFGF